MFCSSLEMPIAFQLVFQTQLGQPRRSYALSRPQLGEKANPYTFSQSQLRPCPIVLASSLPLKTWKECGQPTPWLQRLLASPIFKEITYISYNLVN